MAEYHRVQFGFDTGISGWSSQWHVVFLSSKFNFKPKRLKKLLKNAGGRYIESIDAMKGSQDNPYGYRIISAGILDLGALMERMEELEDSIRQMRALHAPEGWLEEPCDKS